MAFELRSPFKSSASEPDKAYAAGVLDSDGFVGVGRSRYSPLHQWRYAITVGVSQKEPECVCWLAATFGGKVDRSIKTQRKQPMYRWTMHARDAANFLEAILPFLKIKRYRAELGIQLARMMGKRGGGRGYRYGRAPITPEESRRRENVAVELRRENGMHTDSVLSRSMWGYTRATEVVQ